MQEKDIQDFLNDKVSQAKRKEVVAWVSSNKENQKIYNILKAKHVASAMKHSSKHKRSSRAYMRIAAAAAAIIIFAGVYFTRVSISNNDRIEVVRAEILSVSTKPGENKVINLPDGSMVNLNAKSTITYPSIFSKNKRNVTITGEAFFDIAHDKTKPFIVNTGKVSIKVLGTTFNVKSYPEDKKIETTLISGKVELTTKDNDKGYTLKPSHKAIFIKENNDLSIEAVEPADIIAWRKGSLVFKNTPLINVLEELERQYNVEIDVSSEELLTYQYTGTFDNLDLPEILEILKVSSPINFKLKNNKIMIEHH